MDAVEVQSHPTEPNQRILDSFFSAYATFLQAFQSAWMAPEVQPSGSAAYQEYAQVLQELMEHEIRKRMADAWNAYMEIIEKALLDDELQANIRAAYQNYLQSVRQAWTEIDLDGLNALTLSAVSQSLSMASWLAAASSGVASRLSDGATRPLSSG